MSAPTFSLPPCPVCSSVIALDRPFWRFAHNTSRAKGRNCYAFTGCKHAAEVGNPEKIRDDPEEWQLVEDAWEQRVGQLFAERTEGWKPQAVDGLRRALADKAFLPGAVAPLPFTPETPAQQSNEPTKEEPNGQETR